MWNGSVSGAGRCCCGAKDRPCTDAKGSLIAAIEAITVGEPHQAADQEEYLGGISSITLKISGEGIGGAIAGAIGSSTGGYGVMRPAGGFLLSRILT